MVDARQTADSARRLVGCLVPGNSERDAMVKRTREGEEEESHERRKNRTKGGKSSRGKERRKEIPEKG